MNIRYEIIRMFCMLVVFASLYATIAKLFFLEIKEYKTKIFKAIIDKLPLSSFFKFILKKFISLYAYKKFYNMIHFGTFTYPKEL